MTEEGSPRFIVIPRQPTGLSYQTSLRSPPSKLHQITVPCPARVIPLIVALLSVCLFTYASEQSDDAYADAIALYQAHNYGEARVAFQNHVYANPDDASARHYLGRIAMKRRHTEAAIEHFEKSTQLDPTNSDYFAELGEAYGLAADQASILGQLNFAKKCRAALEQAVQLAPDNLEARRGLVDYYRQAPSFLGGGVMKAYAQAEAIRALDLNLGTLILGQLYVADHRFAEATTLFQELCAAQPKNYLAHYSIGRIAAESGEQLVLGELHLQRCLKLIPGKDEPSHAAVHWRLGNIQQRQKKPDAARAAYEKSLQLDPHFARAAKSLADL